MLGDEDDNIHPSHRLQSKKTAIELRKKACLAGKKNLLPPTRFELVPFALQVQRDNPYTTGA